MANKKIAIIGGGASGMMAGITAKIRGADVSIFERNQRVGKKLLSTGNGRCNITNKNILEKDKKGKLKHYFSCDEHFADFSLEQFDNNALLDFFGKLGVMFRCEDGKYYPYSETASTILDILRLYCEKLGVNIITEADICSIEKIGDDFKILGDKYEKVIIACGGMSSPHLGTDGSGYALLSNFGHKRTKLFPAITQIKTDNKFTKQLKGIKCNASVTAFCDNECVRTEYGQVLFCDYGLSGPPVFQLSSCFGDEKAKMSIGIDFMPEFSFEEVYSNLQKIVNNSFTDNLTAKDLLIPVLSRKVGEIIVKYCGIPLTQSEFDSKMLKKITSAIKSFRLEVYGTKGFTNAQVTSGGVLTSEFNSHTMQSKLQKGLYACGEVLDVTGDCGGYNLQWAFSSGYIAGRSAASD